VSIQLGISVLKMNNQNLKKSIFFIFLVISFVFASASDVVFEVSGWVKKEDKSVRRAIVTVFEGYELVAERTTNVWGNFILDLEPNKEFTVIISSEGNVDKSILFNTHLPANASQNEEFFFEFIVDIFDVSNSNESSYLRHMVSYDADSNNFLYHKPIVSEHLMLDHTIEIINEASNCPNMKLPTS
jgi:hypothetical protein